MKSTTLLSAIFLMGHLTAQNYYIGADLSYINEMEDCGAVYFENLQPKDPFTIFGEHHANLSRFRLWHTPTWTNYGNLDDVIKSIGRAKQQDFTVLLDFHLSDTWADPGQQLRPAAWNNADDLSILSDSVYNYIYGTLDHLNNLGLLPEMVQIGNEINGNILLKQGEPLYPNNWTRNIQLLQSGIDAVQEINQLYGTEVKTMIHIAGPGEAVWWFGEAKNRGFTSYDVMGISYYPGWSDKDVRGAADMVGQLKTTHGKEVMIVETGYPWTLEWADNATNSLGISNLLKTYGLSATPENQRDFLTEFAYLVKEQGGMGVIYWEPGWVSTDCTTPWGTGSHWENATFFDFGYNLHEGIGFLDYDYSVIPPALDSVDVIFRVDMTGVDTTEGVFVTGDFTGNPWQFRQMYHVGKNIFGYSCKIPGRSSGAYIFYNKPEWNNLYRETVPAECAPVWNTHREYVIRKEPEEFGYIWGTCTKIGGVSVEEPNLNAVCLYPNPADGFLTLQSAKDICGYEITDMTGRCLLEQWIIGQQEVNLNISELPRGIFFIKVYHNENEFIVHKIIKK